MLHELLYVISAPVYFLVRSWITIVRPSNQNISFTLSCSFMWPQRRVWIQEKSYLVDKCSISLLGEQNRFQSSQDMLAYDNSKRKKELNITRKEKAWNWCSLYLWICFHNVETGFYSTSELVMCLVLWANFFSKHLQFQPGNKNN